MEHYNKNNINILIEQTPKTPRMSVSFFFKIHKKEKYFGLNSLLARLLLQGTKKYSAAQLADLFENQCIDITSKAKQDYLKLSMVFLNEDFKTALELIKELILNSTFDEYKKEIYKMKNEIICDLDNPKFKLTDCFIKTIFDNHPYSSTHTKILADIDKISKEDIIEAHKELLKSYKSIVFVGDYENKNELIDYLSNFSFMESFNRQDEIDNIFTPYYKEDRLIFIEKNDVAQAQILQGWLVDSFDSSLSVKYSVLNNILGASGLSSRLFVNLRDKQGLAYTVRSQYETLLHSGIFNLYIGSAPKNIKKSLLGFESELQKLADESPSKEELQGAKENISGRLKYFSQNNSQINAVQGYNYMMNLGLDYRERFLEQINKVSAQDVSSMAQKLLSTPKLTVIIASGEFRNLCS